MNIGLTGFLGWEEIGVSGAVNKGGYTLGDGVMGHSPGMLFS